MSDPFDSQLATEFKDEAHDRISQMQSTLDVLKNKGDSTDVITTLAKHARGLKGSASSFNFPITGMIAQRFETYADGLTNPTTRNIDDLQKYIDQLSQIVDRDSEPGLEEATPLLQSLPARHDFNEADIEIKQIEVMVVTPSRVVSKRVSTELMNCGYRPVLYHDPLEAMSAAVRVPPRLVIVSAVMDPISGLDLLAGLQAMAPTKTVPGAVLTSSDGDSKLEASLPSSVSVIHISTFSDDFASTVSRFGVM